MKFCKADTLIIFMSELDYKAVMSPSDETEINQNRLSLLDHESRRSVSQTTWKYYYQAKTEITDQHRHSSPFELTFAE